MLVLDHLRSSRYYSTVLCHVCFVHLHAHQKRLVLPYIIINAHARGRSMAHGSFRSKHSHFFETHTNKLVTVIPYLTRAQRGNTESPLARHPKRKRSGRTIGAMSSHIDWIITRQHLVVGKLKQCPVVRRMCVRWPCDLECGISVVAHHTRVKFECPFPTNLFDEIKPPCSVWLRYLPTYLPTYLTPRQSGPGQERLENYHMLSTCGSVILPLASQ